MRLCLPQKVTSVYWEQVFRKDLAEKPNFGIKPRKFSYEILTALGVIALKSYEDDAEKAKCFGNLFIHVKQNLSFMVT